MKKRLAGLDCVFMLFNDDIRDVVLFCIVYIVVYFHFQYRVHCTNNIQLYYYYSFVLLLGLKLDRSKALFSQTDF